MPISEQTYERVALEDEDEQWELVCGQLRAKPGMTSKHNEAARYLAHILHRELEYSQYAVAENSARLRTSGGSYFVPDLCVIPRAFVQKAHAERPSRLEVYEEPMPLVVEVWSPSTGDYDVEEKLREYQRRGDQEIWRLHAGEQSVIAWRRQPDGSYQETRYTAGEVPIESLPGVSVTVAALFA